MQQYRDYIVLTTVFPNTDKELEDARVLLRARALASMGKAEPYTERPVYQQYKINDKQWIVCMEWAFELSEEQRQRAILGPVLRDALLKMLDPETGEFMPMRETEEKKD